MMECTNLPGDIAMREASEAMEISAEPTNKLLSTIRTVQKSMRQLHCALYKGDVYCKPPSSKYTYVYYKHIEAFLNQLSGNIRLAEELVGNIPAISNILSSDSCAVIPQIELDMNLIEVLPAGTCFNISDKKFVDSPIDDSRIGVISPRAFINYKFKKNRVPQPKLFISGLENSFEDPETRKEFMRKYYQCLLTGRFQHKTRKLCVVGPKDSGKTSWVAPFQGIIPIRRIATITREKQFSTQCIDEGTQLVFMDEWASDSLDAETAKKLLQGGFYVVSVKHQRPTTSILRSSGKSQ
jgi:hypothetical protein